MWPCWTTGVQHRPHGNVQHRSDVTSKKCFLIGPDATLMKARHTAYGSLQGKCDKPEFAFFCGSYSPLPSRGVLNFIGVF